MSPRQLLGLVAVVDGVVAAFWLTYVVPSLGMELFDLIRISASALFLEISIWILAWVFKDE